MNRRIWACLLLFVLCVSYGVFAVEERGVSAFIVQTEGTSNFYTDGQGTVQREVIVKVEGAEQRGGA